MLTNIYILKDPESNEIRYIGKSNNPIKRLARHIYRAKNRIENHKNACWIRKLLKNGKTPEVEIIEVIEESKWQEREKYYIKYYKTKYNINNISEGGEGGTTLGFLGKRHSEKSKKLMSSARRGIPINQNDLNGNRRRGIRKYFDSVKVKIYQYDLEGRFILEWESSMDAANKLNLVNSNIIKCCNSERFKCGNFRWSYIKSQKLSHYNSKRETITEKHHKIREKHQAGISVEKLSNEYDLSIRSIYRIIK